MSVVANVAINVDSRDAVSKLRQVQAQSQATERAAAGIGSATTRSLNTATASISQTVGAIGKLAAAYIGLRTAQEAIQAGIQREESQRRLTFLAKGYGEVARAQELAAQSGKLFGLSATESNQQFAQLYGRLRPLNVSVEDINAAFVGFNTAAKVSGTTAAESAGALLQLTQALGSGVLRGAELNSVLEQAPGLVVALTKELGVPVIQIRKLAEDGKITSEVVIRALKRAGTEGADELAAAMNGPAQAVKNLQNEFENFQVAATQDLIPTVVDAMKGLRELLISLGPVIRGLGGIAAQTIGTITDLINAVTKPGATAASIAIKGGRLPLAGFGGMSGAGELFKGTSGAFGTGLTGLKAEAAFLAKQRRQPVTDVLLQLMKNRLQRMETPAQVSTPDLPATFIPSGAAGGGGGGGTGASEAEQAANRLAEEIKRSFEEGKNLTREFERQKALLNATTDFDRQRLQIQFEYQDNVRKIAELKNAEQAIAATILNREIRKLEILKLQREEQEAIRDALESTFKNMPAAGTGKEDAFRAIFDQRIPDAIKKSKDQLKELTDPANQIIGAATAIGDAFAQSFKGIVSGSMTAQQALAGFFQSVADHFIDMAAQIAAEAIKLQAIQILQSLLRPLLSGGFSVAGPGMDLPGLGGAGALGGTPITPGGVFAEGGFVTGPTNALIGEGGEPEYVIPASKMRSAMGRYAAGARGSSVIPSAGGDGGPNQPGGAATSPIDVRYTVERINSVDYVTADQFQAGMQRAAAQGAQRGEQRALRSLQQSTSVRSKVGLR